MHWYPPASSTTHSHSSCWNSKQKPRWPPRLPSGTRHCRFRRTRFARPRHWPQVLARPLERELEVRLGPSLRRSWTSGTLAPARFRHRVHHRPLAPWNKHWRARQRHCLGCPPPSTAPTGSKEFPIRWLMERLLRQHPTDLFGPTFPTAAVPGARPERTGLRRFARLLAPQNAPYGSARQPPKRYCPWARKRANALRFVPIPARSPKNQRT